MSLITKSRQTLAENLNVLSKTKEITAADLKFPQWEMLSKEYAEHQSGIWIEKALISMLNAIIYQRACVFILARSSFRVLCREDKNWSKSIGLKNNYWKLIILEAIKREFIVSVYRSSTGISVYRVVHPEILKFLDIDAAKQLHEVIAYADKVGVNKGDTIGDVEGEVVKEREVNEDKAVALVEGSDQKLSLGAPRLFNLLEHVTSIHKKIIKSDWPGELKGQFRLWYDEIHSPHINEDEQRYYIDEYLRQFDSNLKESKHYFSKKRVQNLLNNEIESLERAGIKTDHWNCSNWKYGNDEADDTDDLDVFTWDEEEEEDDIADT